MLEHMRRICLDDLDRRTVLCLNCHQPLAVEMVGHGTLRHSLERFLESKSVFKGVFHTGNTGKCEFVVGIELVPVDPAKKQEVIQGAPCGVVDGTEKKEVIEGILCEGKCACGHANEMLLGLPFQQFRQFQIEQE